MTAPGTIVIAKMLVPETEQPLTAARTRSDNLKNWRQRTRCRHQRNDGWLYLALNVAAMLISFLALVALVDGILGGTHNFLAAHGIRWFPSSWRPSSASLRAGSVDHRRALARLQAIGNLLGTRMVLNELVAYTMLGAQKASLDPRSFTIATFALCGFANRLHRYPDRRIQRLAPAGVTTWRNSDSAP